MINVQDVLRQDTRGFTLLEVLVVLVIVSLVSVVLIQGLGIVLNIRERLGSQMFELDRATLIRSRVTVPIEGLIADFDDGEHQFSANSNYVSGLTLTPLLRRAGRPLPFTLTIDYDASARVNTLVYREDEDQPVALASWQGEKADFRFIGDSAGWADVWPPPIAIVGSAGQTVIADIRPPQLPELVVLNTGSQQEPVFVVAVQGRRKRVPRSPVF